MTEIHGLKERLLDACVGKPATIAWPHRLLHESVARIESLERALTELLRGYDEERGAIDCSPEAWCPECTLGTTPHDMDKGPCAYHYALSLLKGGT